MSVKSALSKRTKRSWQSYGRVFGRAHSKARLQLETSLPLLQHLEELRRRGFKAFAAVITTTLLSFVFAGPVINYLAQPIGGSVALVSIDVTENVGIFMRVSLLSGIMLGMPAIVYQALRFVLPGLKGKERRWLLLGVPGASLLFATGVAFAWFMLIPTAIPFLIGFLGITTHVRPQSYFEFITTLMFWIGLFFEMPMVFMLLAKLRLVTAKQLLSGWRYALVGIAVAAAAITPTIDPVTMGLVMLPLSGLYGISIFLASLAGRG